MSIPTCNHDFNGINCPVLKEKCLTMSCDLVFLVAVRNTGHMLVTNKYFSLL